MAVCWAAAAAADAAAGVDGGLRCPENARAI